MTWSPSMQWISHNSTMHKFVHWRWKSNVFGFFRFTTLCAIDCLSLFRTFGVVCWSTSIFVLMCRRLFRLPEVQATFSQSLLVYWLHNCIGCKIELVAKFAVRCFVSSFARPRLALFAQFRQCVDLALDAARVEAENRCCKLGTTWLMCRVFAGGSSTGKLVKSQQPTSHRICYDFQATQHCSSGASLMRCNCLRT